MEGYLLTFLMIRFNLPMASLVDIVFKFVKQIYEATTTKYDVLKISLAKIQTTWNDARMADLWTEINFTFK